MFANFRSNLHTMHMPHSLSSGSFMSKVSPVLALSMALAAPTAFAQSFPQTPDTGTAALASQPALTADTQAPQLPALGEGIIVSVNNDMITSYDLKQRMLLLIVTSGVQVTQENYASFQQQALNSLIDERLQQQEMDHWKVKVSDSDVDEEVTRMAAQSNLKPDQLLSELKRVGVEPATLRAQIGAESGWSQLVGGRYHANANVGSAQVDSLMDKVIADGQKPQYLVAEIFIDNTTAGSPANALQGAKQLREQIANKVAPFQAVARQFSNSPSAANGGDAGWLVSGNIDPAVETVLTSLQPGEMSEPIPTKDGVYVYLLRQKTDGNADMVFRLKQAAVSLPANASPEEIASANTALASFRAKVDTCQAFDDLNGKSPAGVQVTDLGDAQLSTLLTNYSDALRPLKTNEATAPLRNAQNMNVLYVCDRALAGDNALSRDQVENNLVNQRLAMLGKRYLRELRSAATIENH
jgi:peptidyl-prolyl cis-trans isomerase SurA